MIWTLILFALILLVLFILFRIYKVLTNPLLKLPGPSLASASKLTGNFREIQREAYLEPHKRWWDATQRKAKMMRCESFFLCSMFVLSVLTDFGPFCVPSLVVIDPELQKQIMGPDYNKYEKRLNYLRLILGLFAARCCAKRA